MKTDKWIDCYDGSWKDLIVPEAFSHPAKMAYGLLERIYRHIEEQGWLEHGSIIVDPFGGIGSTGILGAYHGYRVICVELEARFVDLANQNFKLHENAWNKLCCVPPEIFQGDSRHLSEIIEKAEIVISSPPFQESLMDSPSEGVRKMHGKNMGRCSLGDGYDSTPSQLGAMKPGDVDCVISSPPYAESLQGPENGIDFTKSKEGGKRKTQARSAVGGEYSDNPSNLGNLKPGRVDAVVSSPPYEGSQTGQSVGGGEKAAQRRYERLKAAGYDADGMMTPGRRKHNLGTLEHYGNSEGQLGQEQGDTFWQAAKEIVRQCYQILKPGGYAIWVVKDFVRNKRRVDFCGDWRRLCEDCGFETIHEHHAMLVKEDVKESLFGHKIISRKERKSFFRRLAESKGSPRIDYETILCMRKSIV